MARIRKKSLIQRYSIPYTTRTLSTVAADADNPFANTTSEYVFVRGEAEYCTVQKLNGYEMSLLPEGTRSDEMYKVFTNTALHPDLSDSDSLSDALYLPSEFWGIGNSGGWFKVISCEPRLNGVIEHYEITVTRDYNLSDQTGLSQYPDTTTLDSLITSRADLKDSSVWLTDWEAENT